MNRAGLTAAIVIAVLSGLIFFLFPRLDILISKLFFDEAHRKFLLGYDPTFQYLRRAGQFLFVVLLVALPILSLIFRFLVSSPQAQHLRASGIATAFLLFTFLMGPGVLVNGILKNYWHRPRPSEIFEFNGQDQFVPWWNPRGECRSNCSFVSGEASAAFTTLSLAALAYDRWRLLAYFGSLMFGSALGFVRIATGGHFLSDIIFAGIISFLVVWITHGLFYRWSLFHVLFKLDRWDVFRRLTK